MSGTFVTVPTQELDNFLTCRGFTPGLVGSERVYTRSGKEKPNLRIVVYSSVKEGEAQARKKGQDAIRVLLLGSSPSSRSGTYCLHKTARINRVSAKGTQGEGVQAILGRIWDRVKEACEASKKFGGPCRKCGAPTYSDSGRCTYRACREGTLLNQA
jgi:hypothetical protein